MAHYFILLPTTQGIQMARLICDPLERGRNLFGTGAMALPDVASAPKAVWQIQVGLILVGHIVSVAIAHARRIVANTAKPPSWMALSDDGISSSARHPGNPSTIGISVQRSPSEDGDFPPFPQSGPVAAYVLDNCNWSRAWRPAS